MIRLTLSLLTLATMGLLTGCNSAGGVDTSQLTPIIGEQNAHLLGAGGHLWNAGTLGPKQENAIGESVGVAVTNRYPLVPSDTLQKYVMLVGLTVANASPNPGAPWVFGVIDSPDINAFSGPNGYVFITKGALRQMHSEAELAGVLAHEVGHVCAHDGLEQVKAAERNGVVSEAVKAGGAQTAQFTAIADLGVDVLTKQQYSQPQELKADAVAVHIMSDAGYDANAYLQFLQRLQGISSGGGVMSTHPNIGLRIQTVGREMGSVKRGGATLADRFTANARLAG